MMNPYDVLGIPHNSEFDIAKRAYKKLAIRYHPDKESGNSDKFREITEAFNMLKNNAANDGIEPELEFEEDTSATVELTLEEMVYGCSKKVSVYVDSIGCGSCCGFGYAPGSVVIPCVQCLGTGKAPSIWGFNASTRLCTECDGRGLVPAKVCQNCNGKGKIGGDIRININIPAGTNDGQKLVFSNVVDEHIKGQLIIKVIGIPHLKFKRRNNDLITSHKISVFDAMCGCKITVENLNGKKIDVDVPPGTQPGRYVTVCNAGVSRKIGKTNKVGNLRIKIQVSIPEVVTPEATKILNKLADVLNQK